MKVKHLLYCLLAIAYLSPQLLSAQGIAIAPAHAVCDYNLGDKADRLLGQKMKQALTANGVSSESEFARFALVPNITIVDEHTSTGLPPKTSMELSFTFAVTDAQTGNVFDSFVINTNTKGSNKANTLHKAIASLQLDNGEFRGFVSRSRGRIVDYYERQVDNLINLARSSAKQGEYGFALYTLSEIPSAIPSYSKVVKALEECYQNYANAESKRLLQQAEAVWAANPTASGAQEAMEIVREIPMGTKQDKAVKAFMAKVSKKMTADNQREWALLEKEAARRHAEKQAVVKAARDVAVAYAKNQPKKVYNNIILW